MFEAFWREATGTPSAAQRDVVRLVGVPFEQRLSRLSHRRVLVQQVGVLPDDTPHVPLPALPVLHLAQGRVEQLAKLCLRQAHGGAQRRDIGGRRLKSRLAPGSSIRVVHQGEIPKRSFLTTAIPLSASVPASHIARAVPHPWCG